jgi:serine/threonine-protein kinase RsbW
MAQIELQLILPRDARYVPLLREVADSLLRGLDAPRESVFDVMVALSEACSNVVRHATGSEEYAVALTVDPACCEIRVYDLGPGIDPATLTRATTPGSPETNALAEDGRGLPLLDALMDELEFVREDHTTTVRLVKRWDVVGLG